MYYLVEITKYNNETADAYGVYAYDTLDGAVAAYHQKLRGAIVNETYASELCMIINGLGAVQRYEYWERNAE